MEEPIIPTPPRHSKVKKVLKIFGFTIFGAISILYFLPDILGLFFKDIPPIDDSDIRFTEVLNTPKDQNAYFDLVKLEESIYFPDDKSDLVKDIVAGKTWDEQVVEEIILQNVDTLVHFNNAAQKPLYQDPIAMDPKDMTPDAVLPPLNIFRNGAYISALKALSLSKEGKGGEAVEEALNSARIGQKIQNSRTHLIGYLISIVMKQVGMGALQGVTASSSLKTDDIKKYIEELDNFYKNEEGLINSFRSEYRGMLEPLDIAEVQEFLPNNNLYERTLFKVTNYRYQPNKMDALYAGYAREHIQNVNRPCYALEWTEFKKLSRADNTFVFWVQENAIGYLLHDITGASSRSTVITRKCEEDALVATTQTLLAIKAYKNDTKKYPDSLDQLVPTYLSKVPEDPFDGKSIKYSLDKKIIYSVGRDLKDSGGVEAGENKEAPSDQVVKILF